MPASRPTTSCIIDHFDYGEFVAEAVDSALKQTEPIDEIVLVDDGSDAPGLEAARRAARLDTRVRLIEKPNGGQLSAFNAGFGAASGDIVFFLDADDAYEPDYVRLVLDAYASDPRRDCVFCGFRRFGTTSGVHLEWRRDRDLGYSVIYALFRHRWLGAPTSCLSFRRGMLERILPLPLEQDWRARADDCLVFGASVVGARKYYLARPLVRYRTHASNRYHGAPYDPSRDYLRKLAINRLLACLCARRGYDRDRLTGFAHREFATIGRPSSRDLRAYLAIAMRARVPWSRRFGMSGAMLGRFLGARLAPGKPLPARPDARARDRKAPDPTRSEV